jgi:hypothetical protein
VAAAIVAALVVVATDGVVVRAGPAEDAAEAATARRLAAVRSDPLLLEAFLREMPKGGDLHNHLSGSIYAESYLQWAVEEHLCLATATLTLVAGTCDANAGRPPAAEAIRDPALYSAAIDAWSMRDWPADRSGHDHFFASFLKFNAATVRFGDMLAELSSRAASENLNYVETMVTPDGGVASRLGREAGWMPDLAQMRTRLLAGFDEVKKRARERLDAAETRRNELQKCGGADADPGCRVAIRYLSQVLRAGPPEQVFAQMLAGFELAMVDPRIVGINMVQPEDDPIAVREFARQMSMIDFLHQQYPSVRIALHAGELAPGLVPPEVMRSHIRSSIRQGHALRVGHGTDLIHEDDPVGLLRELAAKKVLVEIALTSNDVILGVKGRHHPIRLCLQYGVPLALVSDDLGVSRSTHTREWVRAVEEHGLDYLTLKRLARNSIDYAFVDAATRTRLKSDLESAFHEFERRQAQTAPVRPMAGNALR